MWQGRQLNYKGQTLEIPYKKTTQRIHKTSLIPCRQYPTVYSDTEIKQNTTMLIAVNLCRFYSFINKPSIYTYMFKRLQNAKASTLLLEIGPGSRIVCSFLTTILFDGFMRVLWHDALHQRKGFLRSWKTIGQKPETGSP